MRNTEEITKKILIGKIPNEKKYYVVTLRENVTYPEKTTIFVSEYGDAMGYYENPPLIVGAVEIGEVSPEEAVESLLQETDHAYLVEAWEPLSGNLSVTQSWVVRLCHRDDCYCRQH